MAHITYTILRKSQTGGTRSLPLPVLRCILAIQRCQILCQFDATIIKAIQLLHDEVKVRGEVWSCRKTPE